MTNQTEKYLLACCRYVELNPLRAGIEENPSEYPWSSCGAKTGRRKIPWLDLDHFYLELDENREIREKKYQDWILEDIPEEELAIIRNAVQRGQLTGKDRFIQEISEKIGRRIEPRGQGRPKIKK